MQLEPYYEIPMSMATRVRISSPSRLQHPVSFAGSLRRSAVSLRKERFGFPTEVILRRSGCQDSGQMADTFFIRDFFCYGGVDEMYPYIELKSMTGKLIGAVLRGEMSRL